jgi:hypothetical protein
MEQEVSLYKHELARMKQQRREYQPNVEQFSMVASNGA